MTIAGWLVMLVSIGSVLSLTIFCMFRVLTLPPVEIAEHLHAPLDIDTGDTADPD